MASAPPFRFGPFEFDPAAGELRRAGERVHLQDKPLRLLQILAARAGEVVSRAELQQALWPGQNFGDFDDGLNTVVRKLREALADDAEQPRYIVTVPRRGYRWVAPLAPVAAARPPAAPARPSRAPGRAARRRWLWTAAAILAAAATTALLRSRSVFSSGAPAKVLLAAIGNSTGDARLSGALDTALAVSLEQSNRFVLFPRDRVPDLLPLLGQPVGAPLTPALARAICRREGLAALIEPAITRTGQEYALTVEIVDPASGAVVASHIERAYGSDHILDALGVLADDLRRDAGDSFLEAKFVARPLPEVTTPSLAALQDYADGLEQWRHGRFAAAVTLYKAALLADPDFAMAHAALADADCSYIYYDETGCRGEFAKALAQPRRLTDRERALIEAIRADDLGMVDTASALYQSYLDRYPDDWPALNDYAHFLRLHGRQADAIPIYRRLLRVAPNDARSLVELATAEMSSGDYPASLAAYQEAFHLDPEWELAGDTNREYGFTLVKAGHPDQAVAAFALALRQPALRAYGLVSLARLDFWQGHLARAEARIHEALQAPGNDPLAIARRHLLLGQIAWARGDRPAALRQLAAAREQWKQIGPKVAFGSLLGQEFARDGDAASAASLLAAIVPLAHPQNHEEMGYVRLLRAAVAAARGRPAESATIAGLPDANDGSSVQCLAVLTLAQADQQAGNLPAAIAWFRQVTGPVDCCLGWEPQPRRQEAYYWLARDELALGNRPAARASLAPLLTLLAGADADFGLHRQALALAGQLH